MKFSKFLFGTTIGLAAGLLALYYKGDKRVQAPAKKPNTKVFDDFSAVDLSEFTDHLALAAADKTALVLDQNDDEYVSVGSLTTPVFALSPFKNLVASWNALTQMGRPFKSKPGSIRMAAGLAGTAGAAGRLSV
ncbi:hypothetical protein [Secundilactobacillus silagei]|uniref:hypothetical protein n=1 Tax=Secundilactobacillus silagei TaxID=1293415 RepID=UPI0020933624|nr:hypothetical protein [Secundilactobacillus silagei]